MKIYTLGSGGHSQLAVQSSQSELPQHLRDGGPTTLAQLLAQNDWPQLVRSLVEETSVGAAAFTSPETLLAPITEPTKILCVGRNYAEHAAETGAETPAEPLIFSKLPTTIIGHGHSIVLPRASQQIDFEAELVVVIGKRGQNIRTDDALDFVAGYTCGNDVTARDWQKGKPGQQWLLGKSFDTFAPLGPCFVSADEIPDPQSLDIQLRLNGTVMQKAKTADMMYSVRHLIAYISQVCTLVPGDLIFTGTPAGVGVARQPQIFLQPGDEVEVEIEGIGCLTNRCVAATE